MKFKNKMVAILAGAMILTACGSSTPTGTKLASLDADTEITSNDVYQELLTTGSGKSSVFQYILKEIVTQTFPITEAMKQEAEISIENIQNSYAAYYGGDAEAQLLSALQESGFESLDDYKETLLYSLQLKDVLIDYINENLDTVMDDYYNTKSPRYVSHILVMMSDPDNPTEEEQAKLDEVTAKLAEPNADFAAIAKEYSDDGSASAGGDLGICDADTEFVTEFLEAALALNEGEVSPATKSQYGYHFITVTSTDKEQMKKDPDVLEDRLLSYDQYMLYTILADTPLTFGDETIQKVYEEQLNYYLGLRDASKVEEGE